MLGKDDANAHNEKPLIIGVAACFFHPDFQRTVFKGKRLLYGEEYFLWWVQSQGALPVILPTLGPDGGTSLTTLVHQLDGLLLGGGSDVSPLSYGEQPLQPEWGGDAYRDAQETQLIHKFIETGKPILGVCRGLQILNVALGGTLYQDIPLQIPGAQVHRNWQVYEGHQHSIAWEQASHNPLAAWHHHQDRNAIIVNSIHHQAIRQLAGPLQIGARSIPDGIIEAIYHERHPFCVGVQWHPEFHYSKLQESPRRDQALLSPAPLLEAFLAACHKRRTKV